MGEAGQEWGLPTALQSFPKSCAPIPLPPGWDEKGYLFASLTFFTDQWQLFNGHSNGAGRGGPER